ncbi:MAG: DEAD/DEAH box helicase [Gemmatimonadaceae bacterium]|nr:DEAD/DEAH box helicase [Gemmatimonadaceae bacterium]
MLFKSLPLHPGLLRALQELGFLHPTQIQQQSIPPALEGKDLLACAATGSGKTAAFLLPILHKLVDRPRGTTRALVVTPTRELAAQILEHLDALAVHTGITAAAIYGGVGMGPQERAFRSGVDVLVATPGRLLDHLKQPYASLAGIEHLVLDEADRMLDMGFLPDIKRILKQCPPDRQTLFFSATMPAPIMKLADELLRNPEKIATERQAAPARGITQALYPVAQELKAELLIRILERGDMQEALVFTRTKHRANRLCELLVQRGIPAERIHGNRSQGRREAALDGFKDGKYRVLVATDVAARGIDVEALGHVVNFDVPAMPEDYIHRVGRTGRAEATGEAFTFVAPDEEGELRAIEKAIARRLPRVTVPDFDYAMKPAAPLEIPLADRIKEIRARKAEERKRAAEKAERRAAAEAARGGAGGARTAPARGGGGGRGATPRPQGGAASGRHAAAAQPATPPRAPAPRPAPRPRDDDPYADGATSGGAPRRRRGGRGRGRGPGGSGGGTGSTGGARAPR